MNNAYVTDSEQRMIALAELDALRRKALLSMSEAARLLGWGVAKCYLAARRGELPGASR